jgi:hypothetical protein
VEPDIEQHVEPNIEQHVEPVENLIDEDQELILRFGTVGSKAYKFVNNIFKRFF